jgi:5-methylcytosine-specific restriction enzyme A
MFTSPYVAAPRPDNRPSASRRFYGRDHERWRRQVLLAHPICRRCELDGDVLPATVAHHLHEVSDRPDLRLDVDNGVGVCDCCHNQLHHGEPNEAAKFRKQMAERGYGVRPAGADQ